MTTIGIYRLLEVFIGKEFFFEDEKDNYRIAVKKYS